MLYRQSLKLKSGESTELEFDELGPALGQGSSRDRRDIHAIFIPEVEVDLEAEAMRLMRVMDR